MPYTNGHGRRRAILYARVSTDEQARSGYSLAQQIEALRAHAAREGYEVLEEVSDPGQSGASLERPGMDRVRDLVAAGGVSVVLAQDRDRFAREPAYHYLLRREFEGHGCKMRALNDRGDESPEGELTDGILDLLGKYERAKIAERTRRGKLRRAREGKILPVRHVKYGFKLNAARDAYEVDEKMTTIRRIFHMIGVEGMSLNAVMRVLEREGVPTPAGGRHWDRSFFRVCVLDDIYRPHTFEEVAAVASPEVAAGLDKTECYGIWWFNRLKSQTKQVSEASANGRRYRKETRRSVKPKEEWIAVPVPDSGIPREVVDAARERIKENRTPSIAGRRFWELSGGIIYCGGCGRRMGHHSVMARSKKYHYYRCSGRNQHLKDCPLAKNIKAEEIESAVWHLVSELLLDPDRLRAGLDEMIEREREELRADPDLEAKGWAQKLAGVERKRASYQDMAAEGLITFDELRVKLEQLEETREVADRELSNLEHRKERLARLEADKTALLERYAESDARRRRVARGRDASVGIRPSPIEGYGRGRGGRRGSRRLRGCVLYERGSALAVPHASSI